MSPLSIPLVSKKKERRKKKKKTFFAATYCLHNFSA
jgi:hypothetical protein